MEVTVGYARRARYDIDFSRSVIGAQRCNPPSYRTADSSMKLTRIIWLSHFPAAERAVFPDLLRTYQYSPSNRPPQLKQRIEIHVSADHSRG